MKNRYLILKSFDKFQSLEYEEASYWEVFDNAWGLVLLSFELLIYRLSRLINVHHKNLRVDPEKEERRSDILSVLNDIDRLSKGAYKEQLCSVKHFFKEKLSISRLWTDFAPDIQREQSTGAVEY